MTDKERIAELEKENAELQQKYLEESYEKAKLVKELKEAEDIPTIAYLQGASRQKEEVMTLNERNADLQKRLDTLQGFLDRDVEYDELKNNLKNAKRLLEILVEEVGMLPGCYRTMIVDDAMLEAKLFLKRR